MDVINIAMAELRVLYAKERKGKSAPSGAGGKKAIKVKAPTVIRGAVSPMARDKAMIMPVRMLPAAEGRTWW